MVISTRKATVKFSEGDKVLCYEPDPTKAKVLYDSKVLDVRVNRDSLGRKITEYLIHFSGWSSSWDRIVKEEFILPDTEENRLLQENLAKEAATFLKGKKKYLPPVIRGTLAKQDKDGQSDSEKNDTNDEEEEDDEEEEEDDDDNEMSKDEDSTSESESEIELFPEPIVRHNIIIKIPEPLQRILREDCKLIKEKKKVIKLPCEYCAMFILESYVKSTARSLVFVPLPPTPKEAEDAFVAIEKKIDFIKEVMHELMILMNYLLPRTLLYNEEKEQYNAVGKCIILEKHVSKECNSEHYKICKKCETVHINGCLNCRYCHYNNCPQCLQAKIKKCWNCQDKHIENCPKCSATHLLKCITCLRRHLKKCHACMVKHCNNCNTCFNCHVKNCSICAPDNTDDVADMDISSSEPEKSPSPELGKSPSPEPEKSPSPEPEKPPSPEITRRSLRSDNKRLSTDSDAPDVVPRKLRKSTVGQSQQMKELSIQVPQNKELRSLLTPNKELSSLMSPNRELRSQNKQSVTETPKTKELVDQGPKDKDSFNKIQKHKTSSANQKQKDKDSVSQVPKNKESVHAAQKNEEPTEEISNSRELRSHAHKSKDSTNKSEKNKGGICKENKNKEVISNEPKRKGPASNEQKRKSKTNGELANDEEKTKSSIKKESEDKEQKGKESIPKVLKGKELTKNKENEKTEFTPRRNLRSSGKIKTEDGTVKEESFQEPETPVAVKPDVNNSAQLKKEPPIEDVTPTRKSTRSTRSSVSSDTLLSPSLPDVAQDPVVDNSISPSTSRKKCMSSSMLPITCEKNQSPVKTEVETPSLHSYKPSFFEEISGYELVTEAEHFNKKPAAPSLIYGAHHLLRLFVKLPVTLNKLSLSEEKMADIMHVIHCFLDFLVLRKEVLFPESCYGDYTGKPAEF